MNQESETVGSFDVEGQLVRCFTLDGHRLWRCECSAFRERLARLGEGFCDHTAVAIMRCLQDDMR